MKAKIIDIKKNIADFQNAQIDVSVEYSDDRFPNKKRLFIFTLPPEKFSEIDSDELRKMIKQQGLAFIKVLDNTDTATTKETDLSNLINQEINI